MSMCEQDAENDRVEVSQLIRQAEELLQEGKSGLGLDSDELPRGFDKELAKLQARLETTTLSFISISLNACTSQGLPAFRHVCASRDT